MNKTELIKYASDNNVRFIDTAPSYSLSEYIIGKFIKSEHYNHKNKNCSKN